MKSVLLSLIIFAVLSLSACGWKPSVTAVPLTAPWTSMNLPVEKDAVVWASTPTEFKAVHKAGRSEVGLKYLEALTKNGWTITKRDTGSMDFFYLEKGGEKIRLNVYDFENTGVIIDTKW